HIREVVPGRIDGDYIAISAGLSPGERVVTDGVDRLREGSKVEVVDTPVAEPASPGLLHESPSANPHEGS
ncbi:MAG TPA: multidrug transporter subunit MdtA, partial [Burkholderiaceae bacterium]|nr:multidrug transporter subunit MdtA [Burkholderiaceae bacterium]